MRGETSSHSKTGSMPGTFWPGGRFAVEHYLRLEERFDFNTETWNSLNSLRLRYRLRATYRWAARVEERYWTATASGEGFVTLAGEQGQQQERGEGRHPSSKIEGQHDGIN